MIYKEISGRLGNQMFQYAAVRKIYEENKESGPILLNFNEGVYNKDFKNELKEFNILPYKEVSNYTFPFVQNIVKNTWLLFEKTVGLYSLLFHKNIVFEKYKVENKFHGILEKNGIYLAREGYIPFNNYKSKNKYIMGYFESSKYFDDIKEILLKEFTPKKKPIKENKELYDFILNGESVCVTIRRGDFVSDPVIKKKHFICNSDYFIDAMKIMKTKVKNPRFVVFSDDIEWCKENIKFPGKVMYESGKDPIWEKMRLMYSCKHFIISNSTFSWWAQYLSKNNNKIVIAPNKWRNEGLYKDIYMDEWLLYDVDKKCLVGDADGKN